MPFARRDGEVLFLLQTVFSGRKRGFLNDFGGGVDPGESDRRAAAREFVEETETMYLATDPAGARRTPSTVAAQLPRVEALFSATLGVNPDWWCARSSPNPARPKQWKTFFIEFPYRDVSSLNRLWAADSSGRYRKRRELYWVPAERLLQLYAHQPDRLWKRVRQLRGAPAVIRAIQRAGAR
ncbi:MAG: NUDIX hydrolase [Gammaproteobacteria bacterium]|nr:NUDIX hydrolase [Gammaproteobacteria bacterium]